MSNYSAGIYSFNTLFRASYGGFIAPYDTGFKQDGVDLRTLYCAKQNGTDISSNFFTSATGYTANTDIGSLFQRLDTPINVVPTYTNNTDFVYEYTSAPNTNFIFFSPRNGQSVNTEFTTNLSFNVSCDIDIYMVGNGSNGSGSGGGGSGSIIKVTGYPGNKDYTYGITCGSGTNHWGFYIAGVTDLRVYNSTGSARATPPYTAGSVGTGVLTTISTTNGGSSFALAGSGSFFTNDSLSFGLGGGGGGGGISDHFFSGKGGGGGCGYRGLNNSNTTGNGQGAAPNGNTIGGYINSFMYYGAGGGTSNLSGFFYGGGGGGKSGTSTTAGNGTAGAIIIAYPKTV